MYRFFVDPSDIKGQDIYIGGRDYNHIKNVLRMKRGEVVSISDGVSGNEYRCHIEDIGEERVHLRLDFIKEADIELPVKVTLFQGIPKSDKMDMIIEKCTELGVSEIVPVRTERSVVRLDERKAEKRREHWQGKAEAAAKQSKRAVIPEIRPIAGMEEALEHAGDFDFKLIPYELSEGFQKTRDIMSGIKPGDRIAVFIGPEGGFSEEEIKNAEEKGFIPITLGRRILRTETAAPVLLSWLIYFFEG
ncbi:MAG: 16S rRNA (uracil(1498)-N(3))-methyltransferase [Lachnospiraceae bacterium]|nr:16S rRNA (uracil(1498)-N(3))-methyltransferase [Lachnospiraceae bacterium]